MNIRERSSRKKYNHKEDVNSLFEKITTTTQNNSFSNEWLISMKADALRKAPGWKKSVDAYLVGLTTSGNLSSDDLLTLRNSLALCTDTDITLSEFLYPVGWTICIAITTIACLDISINRWLIYGFTAAFSALWVSRCSWLKPENSANLGRWDRPFTIGAVALLAPMLTMLITIVVSMVSQWTSIHRFNVDRTAFAADPQGFPMLRTFARKNFDVELVLGNYNDSWASTTLNLPNSSVASMSIRPSYCRLNMYRNNVLNSFGPDNKKNQILWIQGVMMHELGHCLDGFRDFPNFGEHTIKVHAIAPIDAKGVSDLPSYLAATEEDSTKIWREALADIFAIGYWRLMAPSEVQNLAHHLRQIRRDAAQDDSTHATMCWIDQAINSSPPSSEKDLFTWADHLRSVSQCTIRKS